MCNYKIDSELCPYFICRGVAAPDLAIAGEHACNENNSVVSVYDLYWGEGGVSGRGILYCVFNLIEEDHNR